MINMCEYVNSIVFLSFIVPNRNKIYHVVCNVYTETVTELYHLAHYYRSLRLSNNKKT